MSTFKDLKGRAWAVRIDVSAYRRIQSATGYKIFDIAQDDEVRKKFFFDFPALCAATFLSAKCDAGNVTQEDFESAVSGGIFSEISTAFSEALVDFFQPLPKATPAEVAKV